MNRLTVDEYGCHLTLAGKSRSEDPHTRCCAVGMRKDKSILGISYNGLKAGFELPEWMKLEENRHKKSELFIHAEDNLFRFVKDDDCDTVYINLSPCMACAKRIVAQKVRRVVYLKEYHSCKKFKEIFDFYGILYEELSQSSKDKIWEYMSDKNNFPELG